MEKSIEELCIFNEDNLCYLHKGYITRCSLCFNFKTAEKLLYQGRGLYNLFDYIKYRKLDYIFPDGNETQNTLE
ncbi:hypothetical protein [Picrophilus oshimae]|uniref:Uncharacterized protein n=1 Tax=Picrophilus torridus (strain ATCC 700027 / DSM 9790 / JCM 10055 / NBRC 100828 / KAW 2/3) TaxID=1122961 RepID=A0A8G2FXW9_PICTO|nr:hypothetical protein [Picrophilus oshimae]SMD31547.1 hypothetical protein SAMN02745355_1497 [Picrophilus oshimae DSM 9789]